MARSGIAGALGAAVIAAGLGLASGAAGAEDFYDASAAELNGPPGSLIRLEGMPRVHLTDAQVYRILYRSTGLRGEPIAVSGLVVAPFGEPPPEGWPVVAWAHPTTGIARKCAPTVLFPDPVAVIPGINELIERRFIIVATDYPGLGTAGPHPYLIGESEGRAVLDSVKAVREMRDQTKASDRFVVWGHSQGGQAALYAGELAASYAPEVKLLGVAAAAPATELTKLFEDDLNSLAGRILTGLALDSWSEVFGASLESMVQADAMPDLREIGGDCIDFAHGIVRDLEANAGLPHKFLKHDPATTKPWDTIAADNTPGKTPAGAPLFIAQGTADTTVDPPVTVNFVETQCAKGARIKFVEYPGKTHIEIAKASASETVAWIVDRFEGKPAPSTCR